MNRESLFIRSILMLAASFFLLPVLTGCADLYLEAYYDDQTWVLTDWPIGISCEGEVFGTVFETTAVTTSTGHYAMDLMEFGANPLEMVYTCQVADLVDGCCGEIPVVIATPMIYPVSLGCGKCYGCEDPC